MNLEKGLTYMVIWKSELQFVRPLPLQICSLGYSDSLGAFL